MMKAWQKTKTELNKDVYYESNIENKMLFISHMQLSRGYSKTMFVGREKTLTVSAKEGGIIKLFQKRT